MGALYSGRCYGSATDAATAVWSGVEPVLSSASPPSLSTVEQTGGVWYVVTRESGVVTASVQVPAVEFAVCDPGASVVDGAQLGFLVLAVWAAAWGVKQLGRAAGR